MGVKAGDEVTPGKLHHGVTGAGPRRVGAGVPGLGAGSEGTR